MGNYYLMGVEGLESFSGNTANCGVKPSGKVSAVALAVAMRPVAGDLLAVIGGWDSLDDNARADLLAVFRGLLGAQQRENRPV